MLLDSNIIIYAARPEPDYAPVLEFTGENARFGDWMMSKEDRKKARERALLNGYLQFRGIVPKEVEQMERPDFVILVDLNGRERQVGVELCEYQWDACVVGGARSRSRQKFHDLVTQGLERAGFDFTSINFWLTYGDRHPSHAKGDEFAAELIRFIQREQGHVRSFRDDPIGREYKQWQGHFDGFPLLGDCLEGMRLARPAVKGFVASGYNDSASSRLEVRRDVIQHLLRKHSIDRWGATPRALPSKWLVICAGAETAHDLVGPKLDIVAKSLDALEPDAMASGFDLVTFWECRAGWEHPIWRAKGA